MTTPWGGRLPISFTETIYDADIPYDSDIRYDGLIINNTSWNGRDQVGIYFLLDVGDGTYLMADDTNFLYLADPIFGSSWSGRIIP